MIVAFRIDDRLVHGMTLRYWCPALKAEQLLVVDDALLDDPMRRTLMSMGLPPGLLMTCFSKSQAVNMYRSSQNEAARCMAIYSSIDAFYHFYMSLCEAERDLLNLLPLSLGAQCSKAGRVRLGNGFYADPEEVSALQHMVSLGLKIQIGSLPEEQLPF